MRYHLRNLVDPNFQHPEFFSTPLGHAIRAGHLEIVKILVEGGSDPDLTEEMSYERPIDMALKLKYHKIVDISTLFFWKKASARSTILSLLGPIAVLEKRLLGVFWMQDIEPRGSWSDESFLQPRKGLALDQGAVATSAEARVVKFYISL
jgi:hypothetical protein